MEYSKAEYLVETFARTKRKNYENYVINAIWNRLGAPADKLQPVTQQYVKRNDGKYALIDLYFPQLNIGVECNEPHHASNKAADAEREQEIIDGLKHDKYVTMLSEKADKYEVKHINVGKHKDPVTGKSIYYGLEQMESRINEVVGEIADAMKHKNLVWVFKDVRNIIDSVRTTGIRRHDMLPFPKHHDILNAFGIVKADNSAYKAWDRGSFDIKGTEYELWFPKMAKVEKGSFLPEKNGFLNRYSDDFTEFYESNEDLTKLRDKPAKKQITFLKSKILGEDAYRFVGVLEYKEHKKINEIETNIYRIAQPELEISDIE